MERGGPRRAPTARRPARLLRLTGRDAAAAARSLALIGVVSGLLTLGSTVLPAPDGIDVVSVRVVGGATIAIAGVVAVLPWRRVDLRWTLALVPVGLALIGVHNYVAATDAYRYGAFFLLLFVWIGLWHPRGTASLVAPLAALAYTAPLVLGQAPPHAPWTVAYALPLYVVTAEVIAWRSARLAAALDRLDALTRTDPLTGLPNRLALEQELAAAEHPPALLYLDVDRFKQVNDSLGHHGGDEVLRAVADALRAAVRDDDLPVRVAGDEFAVLLRGPVSPQEAALVAERICGRLAGTVVHGATVSTSIGVAWADGDGLERLLARADGAMYRAKGDGGARVVLG